MEKVLIIRGDEITALYSDELRELGGTLRVKRASDVEWNDGAQGWVADIRGDRTKPCTCDVLPDERCPRAETRLGPFATREEALKAEVDFIQARL